MKPTLLTLTLAALLGLNTGCDNNKVEDTDGEVVERSSTTRVEKVEVEREDDHPLAFWTWFDGEDEQEVESEVTVEETRSTVVQQREDKYSDYSGEVKEKDHPLAFWSWFDGDEEERTGARVRAEDEVRYEEEDDGHPLGFLAFWNWGDDGKPKRITEDDVLEDMSPELTTLSETKGEGKIRTAHVLDTNTRMIWDDLRTIFLLDRPSRLTLYPIP